MYSWNILAQLPEHSLVVKKKSQIWMGFLKAKLYSGLSTFHMAGPGTAYEVLEDME